MKISVPTQPYNSRRYDRPWIAIVDFSKDPNGKFSFGTWIGDLDRGNASQGLLEIDANTDDIIATGQKDNRGSASPTKFAIVRGDGTLLKLENRVEALQRYRLSHDPPPDTARDSRLAEFSDQEILDEFTARGLS